MAVRIYVDTNAFITAFEREGPVSAMLTDLFLSQSPSAVPRLVTSILSVAELLVKPMALGRQELVDLYQHWTMPGPHLDVVDADRAVVLEAAKLRAISPALKLPDAIHLATARISNCSHLLTHDSGMKPSFPITVTPLDTGSIGKLLADMERDH